MHCPLTAYEQVRQALPGQERLQTSFGSFIYHFALGDLLREWNDLEAAGRHLLQGMALINELLTLEPSVAIQGYTALARLQQAQGNSRAAFATLEALAHLTEQRHYPAIWVAQGEAVRARLELARGNLRAAIRWANVRGLSPQDPDLNYLRESAYLSLARIRIAQECEKPEAPCLQDILHLLDRLQASAEAKARINSVLEILMLRALALETQGDRTAALSTLEQALLLAEPEGYLRLFVEEGPAMRTLLHQAYARSIVPGYGATLLRAFGEQNVSALPLSSWNTSSCYQ